MATKEEGFSRLKSLFLFRKAVFFIAGLIFGQSLVKYAVLATMIIYLTDNWKESNLPKSVIILNAQEGLSKVLIIFEAHMADAYFGRFYVVVFSSLSMIIGLILLWLVDPAKNLGVFWGVAVLIALGEAGKEPLLKAFLADQLKVKNTSPGQLKEGENKAAAAADDNWKDDNVSPPAGHLKEGETKSIASDDDWKEEENKGAAEEKRMHEHIKVCWSVSELLGALVGTFVLEEKKVAAKEEQLDVHVKIWWSLFKILGALTGTFGLGSILGALCGIYRNDYWGPIFVAPAIVMGVSLVIFLLGYPFYQPEERPKVERSPIWAILKVFTTAFRNRGFQYSEKSTDYFEYDDGGKIPLSPDIPLSRWVDKAALIVETSPPSAKEEANKVKPCTAAQVKEVKQLLRMVPMWATFVVYCITQATGSTFFFEQTVNLNNFIGKYKVPPVSLYLMQASSSNGIMCMSNLVISKWFRGDKKLFAYKVRIGMGMACSSLACVAAMLVERMRLKKVKDYNYYQSPYLQTSMSIFMLTPQFILLGLAEGLTEEGLGDFFDDQVDESSKNYGLSFNQFAMGLGKFFNIFWVLTFNSWFDKTINESRLDKYYLVLAIVGSCNLFFVYTFVSIFVYKDVKGVKWSRDDSVEACFKGCKNAQEPPNLKA